MHWAFGKIFKNMLHILFTKKIQIFIQVITNKSSSNNVKFKKYVLISKLQIAKATKYVMFRIVVNKQHNQGIRKLCQWQRHTWILYPTSKWNLFSMQGFKRNLYALCTPIHFVNVPPDTICLSEYLWSLHFYIFYVPEICPAFHKKQYA